MSTVKLENKRSAVLGAVHTQTLNSCLAFGSPGKSNSVHLLGSSLSWRSGEHPPSYQHNPSGSCSSTPEHSRFPSGSRRCLPHSPCPPRSGLRQLLQEGFDLHSRVWLFKSCSQCWGNFRHVYLLLWERLKTHVSSYSAAGWLCLCSTGSTHAHPAVCRAWGAAGSGTEQRSSLGRIPFSRLCCTCFPHTYPALAPQPVGLCRRRDALCRSCLKRIFGGKLSCRDADPTSY